MVLIHLILQRENPNRDATVLSPLKSHDLEEKATPLSSRGGGARNRSQFSLIAKPSSLVTRRHAASVAFGEQ